MVAQMILVHLVGVRIPAGELKKIKLPPLFLSLAEAFFVPRFLGGGANRLLKAGLSLTCRFCF